TNSSRSRTMSFLLGGFPARETTWAWWAAPLCSMYLLALLGNAAVLAAIGADPRLHVPMYLLLAMLAAADLGLSTSTFPTVLRLLWLRAREIRAGACLAQMFCIHLFAAAESAVLLAMAFDRYVAICHPLRYSSILTSSVTSTLGAALVARATLVLLPLPILLDRLRFTGARRLSHPFCLHPDLAKHAGSGARAHGAYGLLALLSTLGLDLLFVLLSYLLVLRAVLSIATWRGRLKALSTCLSHLCAVLLFFVPMLCLAAMHHFTQRASPRALAFTANLHFLVPPVLNPLVYSLKAEPLRRRMLRMLCPRG
ncbi:O51I2 protein, partial [Centropus bengalensis]|nr:O51I2 protein [Centropus bengalensis]